jgi:hypothetical protein
VGDVEDRCSALSKLGDDSIQPLHFRLGQRAGRLIHDQHLAIGAYRFGDLHQLLIADS